MWLRLYQAPMGDLVPRGRRHRLRWTLRRPFRPLTYHAAHRMFERAAATAGRGATLHSLRHIVPLSSRVAMLLRAREVDILAIA